MKKPNLNIESDSSMAERIVHEATLLFDKKGYHGTTVNDICNAVGISKGGLNYYFKAKEDILLEIHECFINYELECAANVLDKQLPVVECFKELVKTLVESICKFRPYCVVFFQSKSCLSVENFKKVEAKREQYKQVFAECLKKGVEEGVFDSTIDLEILNLAIFGMCNWTLYWIDENGRLSAEEIAEIFCRTLLDGIRKKE